MSVSVSCIGGERRRHRPSMEEGGAAPAGGSIEGRRGGGGRRTSAEEQKECPAVRDKRHSPGGGGRTGTRPSAGRERRSVAIAEGSGGGGRWPDGCGGKADKGGGESEGADGGVDTVGAGGEGAGRGGQGVLCVRAGGGGGGGASLPWSVRTGELVGGKGAAQRWGRGGCVGGQELKRGEAPAGGRPVCVSRPSGIGAAGAGRRGPRSARGDPRAGVGDRDRLLALSAASFAEPHLRSGAEKRICACRGGVRAGDEGAMHLTPLCTARGTARGPRPPSSYTGRWCGGGGKAARGGGAGGGGGRAGGPGGGGGGGRAVDRWIEAVRGGRPPHMFICCRWVGGGR